MTADRHMANVITSDSGSMLLFDNNKTENEMIERPEEPNSFSPENKNRI